jgi:hypothetical protein
LFSLKRPKADDRDANTKLPPSTTPVLRELPQEQTTSSAAELVTEPSSAELRQMLFEAIAKADEARLTELCHKHRRFVQDYAPTWLIVPDSLRANAAASKWYGRGLRQVLQQCCSVSPAPTTK